MSSKLESDVCCRLQVAPSGGSYTAGLTESNSSLLPGLWRDALHVTCGLTACTPGSAPGPTLGNEYGKTLPLGSLSQHKQEVIPCQSKNNHLCVALVTAQAVVIRICSVVVVR